MPPSSGLTRGPLVGENGFCDQHRNGAFNCGPAGVDNGDQVGELRALSLLNAGEFLQTGHQIGRVVAEVLVPAHISLPTMSLGQPNAVIVAFPAEGRKRFFGRASPVANLGRPDRAIGPARRRVRACPTDASGRPGRRLGQARQSDWAGLEAPQTAPSIRRRRQRRTSR